jgi:Zn-dependent protease with chaperone function
LQQKFAAMLQPRGEKIAYRLEFRYSTIGPNALALANGTIIMTDQLAMLARNDEAVLGVLAHELGHLQHRHSLRQLLQAVGVTVLVNLWVGDVSAVLATVPTILLDQKHSRDFEREADRYAVEMLKLNGMPAAPVANLFEKMHRVAYDGRAADERDGKVWEYFSSHPSDKERIEALRAADRGR